MNALGAKSFSLLKTGQVFLRNDIGTEHAADSLEKFLGMTVETLLVH